ncbi:MAG TPA: LuxR family transcriptional regulator [Gaiellaceae bacterium]|nr:LuxR family transcriptional regulator [Gaiellaceae bacterium]
MLVGRLEEAAQVEALLDGLASGPAALVLEGEPGIGKSTIWADAVRRAEARGVRVLQARPAEVEAPLSFAALADMLGDLPAEVLGELPDPQQRALAAALLQAPAPAEGIDERAIAAAVLSVVRLLATERPLLLAVDDAQWLDVPSARALEFVARRLRAEPVGLLVAVRAATAASTPDRALADAARRILRVGPLSVGGLHELFKLHLGHSFARPVLVRIERVSGGNPLYALELARELGRGPVPSSELPPSADLAALVETRLGRLPARTRDALLEVAVLGQAPVALVDLEALAPAEDAGVVEVEHGRVRFAHPIFASVVYGRAGDARRRNVHRRLAGLVADPEEQARHLALGSVGPDAAVAEALEQAAGHAERRGAASSGADLMQLAVRLTPPADLDARVRRGIALGNLLYVSGSLRSAVAALEAVCDEAPPGRMRTEALVDLRGMVTLLGEHDRGAALIDEAIAQSDDRVLAARAHARRAWISFLEPDQVVAHSRAVLELIDETDAPGVHSFALQQLAGALLFAGQSAEHELIERSLPGQAHADAWTLSSIGAGWPGYFDDLATARARREELLARAEAEGNESERQAALAHLALLRLLAGQPREARSLALEALELAEQIEQEPMACVARYSLALAEAHLGALGRARELAEATLSWIGPPPHAASFVLATQAYAALGTVAFAEGDYGEADRWFSLADEACARWPEPAPFRYQGDHAEAVIALGEPERAEALVARLERRCAAIPRPSVCAAAARCRAQLAAAHGDLDAALAAAEAGCARLEGVELPVDRARALLVLGLVRRRRKEKRLARVALEEARAAFAAVEAPVWVARAEAELRRVRTREAAVALTATEEQIARMAAAGLTNRVIAERAFVSTKTVEANLARVYRKLGIGSRAQLARALDARRSHEALS